MVWHLARKEVSGSGDIIYSLWANYVDALHYLQWHDIAMTLPEWKIGSYNCAYNCNAKWVVGWRRLGLKIRRRRWTTKGRGEQCHVTVLGTVLSSAVVCSENERENERKQRILQNTLSTVDCSVCADRRPSPRVQSLTDLCNPPHPINPHKYHVKTP